MATASPFRDKPDYLATLSNDFRLVARRHESLTTYVGWILVIQCVLGAGQVLLGLLLLLFATT